MTNKQIKKYSKILNKIAMDTWGCWGPDMGPQQIPIHRIKDPEFLEVYGRLRRFCMTKADRKTVQKLQFKYQT